MASEPQSTSKKRLRPDWTNESDDEKIKEVVEPEEVTLTPHTHRLLRLIQEGTTEHAKLAASHLTSIAATSSPLILWDLLGRLVETLASPLWSCRYNASLAVEGIARHLPPLDQQEFLASNHEQHSDSEGLWLSISDLDRPIDDSKKAIGLDLVIEKGRLLLASSGTQYDSELDEAYQSEAQQLNRLDASSGTRADFLKERIALQRSILAQRLGFGGVLGSVTDESQFFSHVLTNEDLLVSSSTAEVPSATSRRQQHMERINSRRKEEKAREDSSNSVRALLVMEMNQQQKACAGATSHKNPQTLLGTEFIYQMFSPFWYVRHGALLGALALLRAWKGSYTDRNNAAFGVWPHDILARCVCVLALDRFGDYSGSFDIASDKNSDEISTDVSSGGVVAPGREVAGQLLSMILAMAPQKVQQDCLNLLLHMTKHPTEWEVRHGALLALKYIVAVMMVDTAEGNVEMMSWLEKVSRAAIERLVDSSEDVHCVASQVLSSLISAEAKVVSQTKSHLDFNALCEAAVKPLWETLAKVGVVSTSVVDLVDLFSRIVCRDPNLVLRYLTTDGARTNLSSRHAETLRHLLEKLADFLDYPSLNVKLSALRSLEVVARPISAIIARAAAVDQGDDQSTAAFACCASVLLQNLFDSYFDGSLVHPDDGTASRELERLTSARDHAWRKLVDNFQALFENTRELYMKLAVSLILRYFGIRWPDSSRSAEDGISLSGAGTAIHTSDSLDLHAVRARTARVLVYFLWANIARTESVDNIAVDVDRLLCVTLASHLQSPWPDHCEAACLLYKELGLLLTTNESLQPLLQSSLETCQSLLCDMLVLSPYCMRLGTNKESEQELAALCNSAFTATLVRQIDAKNGTPSQPLDSVQELVNLWKESFKATGAAIDANEDLPPPVSMESVRLQAVIAGCMLPFGRKSLPPKLTPMIRSLMTALKNESSRSRQREISLDIVQMLKLLSMGDDLRVRDRVLENICVLVEHEKSSTGLDTNAKGFAAAAYVLEQIVHQLPSDYTIECLPSIWARIKLLNRCNQSATEEVVLENSLRILGVVSRSLRRDADSFAHLMDFAVPSLVLLACECPFQNARCLSLAAFESFCRVDASRTLKKGLRIVVKYLRDAENDAYRLASCTLLQSIIESAGTGICEFVRYLLPTVMSLMTDPLIDCAKMAARSFAELVMIAPLVRRDQSYFVEATDVNDSATKVIDHLIHGLPLPPCHLPAAITSDLNQTGTTLRQYQKEGVAWLRFLQTVNLNGALCDDMGTGKTLQALVGIAISHCQAIEAGETPVSLVVCPATVVGHWVAEIKKFFPSENIFRVLPLVGRAKDRRCQWNREISACNIVVTSYSYLRSDIDLLANKAWRYCVLDEGHLLKNPKTATAVASRRIRASHRLILTGTPVQNRVHELWAAFDFLMPNFLGTATSFTKEFAKPIALGHALDASAESVGISIQKLKSLHQQVLPFILRREKGQVLAELPPKCITNIPCTMSVEQERLYREFCSGIRGKKSLAALQKLVNESSHELHTDRESQRPIAVGADVLKSLLYLRLICTHPSLVSGRQRSGAGLSDGRPIDRFDSSGKLLALNELLRGAGICGDEITAADNDTSLFFCDDECADHDSSLDVENGTSHDRDQLDATAGSDQRPGGSKCLVFAQFSQSLDVIEKLLFLPHMASLRYLRMDGSTPLKERDRIVESFNMDESIKVMLLTTRVGGLGLNLTGADTVIFVEHDWNPHTDLQAMDRCHRIGQTKTVNVYRLVTSDTIEEQIMKIQDAKLAMSEAIVNTDNSTMYSMGTDRLLDIFAFRGKAAQNDGVESCGKSEFDGFDDSSYTSDDYSSLSLKEFVRGFLRDRSHHGSEES